MSASGAGLRRPGIAFCLAVLLAARFSHSAPVYDQDTTQVAEFNGGASTCYYNYKHYQEGDRIITNEPCLNCTCHNRMLMCYLRVCPFTKAIGQDCTVEKRPDQCCPVITCPEVPVQLLTSTTSSPSSDSTEVGFHDNYGCNVNNLFYADGAQLPIDYHNPCELCYCIRNRTTCVMQECTLNVAGCKPIYQPGVCCPVKYDCDYDEHAETTVRPTPGLIMTTTIAPGIEPQCFYEGKMYEDGELIYSTKPCQHCYCFRGDIACAIQDCGTPMKTHGKNCTALPPPDGECCPTTYQCDSDYDNKVTSIPEEETQKAILEEETTETEERQTTTTVSSTTLETEHKPHIPDETYPGEDNAIPEDHSTDELVTDDSSTPTTEKSSSYPSSTEDTQFTTPPSLSSKKDKDSTPETTEVPLIDEQTTEEQKKVTNKALETSTLSDNDMLTTISDEEISISTEKTETSIKEEMTTKIYSESPENVTMKESVESSSSSFSQEPQDVEKETTTTYDSQYTPEHDEKELLPTEITEIDESTDKSTLENKLTTYKPSSSSDKEEESSTSSSSTTEKSTETVIPELVDQTESSVSVRTSTDFSTKLDEEQTERESISTEISESTTKRILEASTEMETVNTEETILSKSTEQPKLSTELHKDITDFTSSTENILDLTTKPIDTDITETEKLPDVEITTKSIKEDTTTKQSVTIPIAERMPEHKAEDKDSVPEIEMTAEPVDLDNEITPEVPGSYLPPVTSSTDKEDITVTESSAEVTDSTKDLESTRKTVFRTDDLTPQPSTEITLQQEIEKSQTETYPTPVTLYAENSTEKQEVSTTTTVTTTTVTTSESTYVTEKGIKQSTMKLPELTEEIPTTMSSTERDTTETVNTEPHEIISSTSEKPKLTDEEVSSTSEIPVEPTKTEEPSYTTKSPEITSTPYVESDVSSSSTFADDNIKTYTTEISSMDQTMSTEILEDTQNVTDKSEIPMDLTTPSETEDVKEHKLTTTIMTEMKQEETPSTDSLMTKTPVKDDVSSLETTTEYTFEKTSTQSPEEVFSTGNEMLHASSETPITEQKITEASATDYTLSTEVTTSENERTTVSIKEPEKVTPTDSVTEMQTSVDTEQQSITPAASTEISVEEITSKITTENISQMDSSSPATHLDTETPTEISLKEDITTETTAAIKLTTEQIITNIPELEERLGNTEKEPIGEIENETMKPMTSAPDHTPETPSIEEKTLSSIAPKKEESKTEMSTIPEIITPEITQSPDKESSHTTESTQTSRVSTIPVIPEIRPQMGIPGEGNCLVDGQSYSNNSAIPPANNCQLRCRCISSIVQCDLVQCAPPPSNRETCKPIHNISDCCPTYNCDTIPTIESDSHVLEHQTPVSQEESDNQKTDIPEMPESGISQTTLKTIDEHSLITSDLPSTTEMVSDEDITTKSEQPSTVKIDGISKSVTAPEENVFPTSISTTISEEHVTSTELPEKSTESIEDITKDHTPSEKTHTIKSSTDEDTITVGLITEKTNILDETLQASKKPVDESTIKYDEEYPSSTETQTTKPLDDKLTTSDIDETKAVQPSTTTPQVTVSESISSTLESMTEKISTESEPIDESSPTDKLMTETTPLDENKTESNPEEDLSISELHTTIKQPEEEFTTSSEQLTSTEELIEKHTVNLSTSSEMPEDVAQVEDKTTSSSLQPEIEESYTQKESDSITSKIPEIVETTVRSEDYSKIPEMDTSSRQSTEVPSEEEISTITYTTKIPVEISTESQSTSFITEKTTTTIQEIISQTDKHADETTDTSSGISEIPTDATEESTEMKEESSEMPEQNDKYTTPMDHVTEISVEITKETDKAHTEEQTTEYYEDKTQPSSFSQKPEEPTEKLDITTETVEKSTESVQEKEELDEQGIKSTEPSPKETDKPTESPESDEKISEEPISSTPIAKETLKPLSESSTTSAEQEETSPKEEIYGVTDETSEISIKSQTTELPEHEKPPSSEIPSSVDENVTTLDDIYSTMSPTMSSSTISELPEEETILKMTTEKTVTESTDKTTDLIEDKTETSEEPTTLKSTTSKLPESTVDVITETETEKMSSTDEEHFTPMHSSTLPEEEKQPTTSKDQLIPDHTSQSSEETKAPIQTTSELPLTETTSEVPLETKIPEDISSEPLTTETSKASESTTGVEKNITETEPEVTEKTTGIEGMLESTSKLSIPESTTESASNETVTEEHTQTHLDEHPPEVPTSSEVYEDGEGHLPLEPEEHDYNHTIEEDHSSTAAPEYPDQTIPEDNPNFPISGGTYINPDEDYDEDDQAIYGPGTCRYGGKVYMSAQQIPRDDPCDFCFCFRGDIICLQQSCPPPIPGCHEEPISGFCCPRYECPVSMASSVNLTTTTTTTTTTLPPHFLSHAYKGAVKRSGCQVGGQVYRVGEIIKSASGPCLQCTCGGDGNMNCDPRVCSPEPMYRQMVAAATSKRRR